MECKKQKARSRSTTGLEKSGLHFKEGVEDLPYEGIHVVQKAQSLYKLRGITSNMEKKEFYTS